MNFCYNGKNYSVSGVSNRIEQNEVIREHQNRIKDGLVFKDSNMTVFTKTNPEIELSKGCQACKGGTWWCIFLGHNCNLTCKFCSQDKTYEALHAWDHPRSIATYWIDDVKFYLDKFGQKLTGISYSGGEPMMYFDKLVEVAEYVSKTQPHIYQWVYTNGVYLTEEKANKMAELGIKEVRIDLAATNFDDAIVNKIAMVKKHIQRVTVEIPSLYETFNKLINEGYIYKLVENGVTQLNLAELDMRQEINWNTYANNEQIYSYDTYNSTIFSPVYSRKLTLAVMEYVIENNINILVNDCSNDTKHLQSIMRNENCPVVTR